MNQRKKGFGTWRAVGAALASACLAAGALPGTAAAQGQPRYVGPETCKACHGDAYARWKTSAHASADRSFSERQRRSQTCGVCHAPQAGDGLRNVSCESCHGPGSLYASEAVMKDKAAARKAGLSMPGPETCSLCHGSRQTPARGRFEFVQRRARISHGATAAPGPAGSGGGTHPPAASRER